MAYSILGKDLMRNESLVAKKIEIGQGLGPISEIYANRGGAKLTGLLEVFRLIFGPLAQLVEQPRGGVCRWFESNLGQYWCGWRT